MSVGFATSEAHPELTPEDQAVARALASRGITGSPIVWSETPAAAVTHTAVVIRSCWDYHHRPDEFLSWVDALQARGVRVLNSPAILRRNAHKQYLVELAATGAAVIPTRLVTAGSDASLASLAATLNTRHVVIKPAVSASSFHTTRLDIDAPVSEAAFRDALNARDMLVQPFMPEIPQGELSLIFLGGIFSHAVIKRAKAGDFRVQEEYGGSTTGIVPPPSLIAQAADVLRMFDSGTAYARIDGIEQDGRFVLAEAELIEPYLFLVDAPGAVDRFAEVIADRLFR